MELVQSLSGQFGWDKQVKSQYHQDSSKKSSVMMTTDSIIYLGNTKVEKVIGQDTLKVIKNNCLGMSLFQNESLKVSEKDNYTQEVVDSLLKTDNSDLNTLVLGGGHLIMASRLLQDSRVAKVKVIGHNEEITRLVSTHFNFGQACQEYILEDRLSIEHVPEHSWLQSQPEGSFDLVIIDGSSVDAELLQAVLKVLKS